MLSQETEQMHCVVNVIIEIARMAIHDYKNYVEKYNKILTTFADGAVKECRLFRLSRNITRIENFFKEDYYGVFQGKGENYIEKLRAECNYKPRERITYEQYVSILPQEAMEEKTKALAIPRVVSINARKARL